MNITCLQATLLTSKKEEGQTSLLENIKLSIHFSICNGCKSFAKQTRFITRNASDAAKHTNERLSPERKIIIKKLMK